MAAEHAADLTPSSDCVRSKHASRPYTRKIVWRNVFIFSYLHYGSVRGFWLLLTGQLYFYTFLWSVLLLFFGMTGVTAGAHRLWSHRSYKATWPLRALLMVMQTVAFQNHIYEWARDHRGHHKFVDTDADPHNNKRGFFFAHIGWLLVRKHPDVLAKGAGIDLGDLDRDPIVMFQKKYYGILMPLLAFVVPALVPVLLWGEAGWSAWYASAVARYTASVHLTWSLNSLAHWHGLRPIDKTISPSNHTILGHLTLGEGCHNYHHAFPWDYKGAELGHLTGNVTAAFIHFFERIGWAYDLRTTSQDLITRRARRTGDGSHPSAGLVARED